MEHTVSLFFWRKRLKINTYICIMKTKITSLEYTIKPRMKKRWFVGDIKVYDLFELKEGQYWSDPTYGNGGGDYIDFEKEEVMYTFNTFAEANKFREELVNK